MTDLSRVALDPNVEESGSFTVVPDGHYKAVVAGDKMYQTKDKKGTILELTIQIVDGQYSGTTILDRLNILNPSDMAQKIAQGTLKRICNAVKAPYPPQNTDAILGKPMMVKIGVEEFTSNTSGKVLQSNKVKNYAPYTSATAAPAVKGW